VTDDQPWGGSEGSIGDSGEDGTDVKNGGKDQMVGKVKPVEVMMGRSGLGGFEELELADEHIWAWLTRGIVNLG